MTPERLAEIRAVNRSMRFVNAEHVKGVIVELADALEATWASLDNVRASNRFLENRIAEYAHDAEQQRDRAEQAEAQVAYLESVEAADAMLREWRERAERAEVELVRFKQTLPCSEMVAEMAARAEAAEAEVERLRPVVDAALAWRDANMDGFYGGGRMADALREAVEVYREGQQ